MNSCKAEMRTQLIDLRESQARIIGVGDEERRRLERDLHDGAQQQLVGVSLALRLVRDRFDREKQAPIVSRLDEANSELLRAMSDLRVLAHGIHPAVLTDHGLDAALEALAETTEASLRLGALPAQRLSAPVETAVYLLVSEIAASRQVVSVNARHADGVLNVDIDCIDVPGGLVEVEDRIRALAGNLRVSRRPDHTFTVHAELPAAGGSD